MLVLTGKRFWRDGVADYIQRLYEFSRVEKLPIEIYETKSSLSQWLRPIFCRYKVINIQYPQESWGHSVLPSTIPIFYWLSGKKILLTMHEYNDMHPLRRLALLPLILISSKIVFVSKKVEKDFTSSHYSFLNQDVSYVPIGVNLEIPFISKEEVLSKRAPYLAKSNNQSLIIGFFGFIYRTKKPDLLLGSVKCLKEKGYSVTLRILGGFPDDHKKEKAKFFGTIEDLGLVENVEYLGYVEDHHKAAKLLKSCNVVYMYFEDGLTERRGSFWYAYELGQNIITTKGEGVEDCKELISDFNHDESVCFIDPNISISELSDVIGEYSVFRYIDSKKGCTPSWDRIALEYSRIVDEIAT